MKLIGVDSGGTSCRLALCDPTGRVLSACRVPGHNPNADGFEALENSLRDGLDRLLRELGGREAAVDALFAGIAGSEGENHDRLEALLCRLLPRCGSCRVGSDALAAMASGIGSSDGGVLIAGTGTVGFLRMGARLLRFGGWGYLADEGGSGWHLGRDGFRAAMAGEDAGLPPTALTALYEEHLGMKMPAAVTALYRGGLSLADCAPLVLQAAQAGDAPAQAILRQNAAVLAETVRRMQRVFENICPVVLAGGLLTGSPLYRGLLEAQLQGVSAELILPSLPPLFGAVRMAAAQAGVAQDAGFETNFQRSFAAE